MIVDLPSLLNVDIIVIEDALEKLLPKHSNIIKLEGELLSNYYFDTLAKEVNEWIQERSSVNINELATRFILPIQFFMERIINPNLGTVIKAILDGTILYTQDYISRCSVRIRGALSATTKPTPLSQFKGLSINMDFFENLARNLISSGNLSGTLEGKGVNATYIPTIYIISRKNWIKTFFGQNRFIDYSMLRKVQVVNPAALMNSEFSKDGIALSNCFVSNGLVQSIHESTITFIKEDKGWMDIIDNFSHTPLQQEDLIDIINLCSTFTSALSRKENKFLFIDHYIISNNFIRECLQKYESHIRENPSEAILPQNAEGDSESLNTPKSKSNVPSTSQKGKGKRGGNTKKKANQEEETDFNPGINPKLETDKIIANNLIKWFSSETISTKAKTVVKKLPLNVYIEIAGHIRSTIEVISASMAQAVQRGAVSNNKEKIKNFPLKLNSLYLNILLFDSGIANVKDANLKQHLSQYLLSTLCRDVLHLIVENQAILNEVSYPRPADEETADKLSFTNEDALKVINSFPNAIKNALKPFYDNSPQTVAKFITMIESLAPLLECPLKKLDKKMERQLLLQLRQDSIAQIEKTGNPNTLFHLILSVIYIKSCNSILYVNPMECTILLDLVKDNISLTIHQKLSTCKDLILQWRDSNSEETFKLLETNLNDIKKFATEKINLEKYQE